MQRIACQRCRQRKVKCDLNAPTCGNCARSRVHCLSSDISSARAASSLPAGYIEGLEAQVAQLEEMALRTPGNVARSLPASNLASPNPSNILNARSNDGIDGPQGVLDWSAIGETGAGTLHPQLGYGINRLIQSALVINNNAPYKSTDSDNFLSLVSQGSTENIHKSLLSSYLEAYFTHIHITLPFLDEASTRQDFARLQLDPSEILQNPNVLMILAIGSTILSKYDQVATYHRIQLFALAIKSCEHMCASHNLQTLQFLLLSTLLSLLSPSGSTWHLIGLASQAAVTLGLHQKRAVILRMPTSVVEEVSFWACYILDRVISLALGRPFAIDDYDISLQLPSNSGSTERIYSLVSIARVSMLREIPAGDRNQTLAEFHRHIIETLNNIEPQSTDLFTQFITQLSIWRVDLQSLVSFVDTDGDSAKEPTDILRRCLSQGEALYNSLMPLCWTSSYAFFYAFIIQWKYTKLLESCEEARLENTNTPLRPSVLTTAMILESCSRTFPGLVGIGRLFRHLVEPEQEYIDLDLEVVPNRTIRAAFREAMSLKQ